MGESQIQEQSWPIRPTGWCICHNIYGLFAEYVGELRQGIWPFVPLRICGWSEHSGFITEEKRYREFPIQVHHAK